MGLGGGFLMTIWDATTKTADYLNAREVAPSGAHKDMFQSDPHLAMFGGLSDPFIILVINIIVYTLTNTV